MKKNEVVRFQKTPDGEWVQGRVLSRAGKKGRTYDKWWNIQNTVTGHIEPQDFGNMHGFEKVLPGETTETIESKTVYITSIPRYRHQEEGCKAAKEKELDLWDRYQVYEEVKDEGQTKLGTNWILTDKVVNGVGTIKGRLTVRGDQEETSGLRKDSPTVRRGNIKIFSAIAAKEHW